MRFTFLVFYSTALALATMGSSAVNAADKYELDPVHTAVTFKIAHLGLSWTHGRFNDVTGNFVIDTADPALSSFTFSVKSSSVDTGNSKRDEHLRSPDFFNVKQFPVLTFKSTSVKPAQGGYDVTGDLTMHGETRSISFTFSGGRTTDFPPGTRRTGYSTQLKLKRSEFGMDKDRSTMPGAIGDEVYVAISFEGVKS
jgi:polyisoprenoid-binding protein YceI